MMKEMEGEEEGGAGAVTVQPPKPPEEPVPKKLTLMEMCQRGMTDEISELIKEGGDITVRDEENITCLHWAAINGRTELCELLLQKGCEADAKGGELEGTPLQWAVRYGHMETVIKMCQHGAEPMTVDVQGFNALHLAAQFGFPFLCAYFTAQGANVDATDPDGQTALMWAAIKQLDPNVVRMLIACGASLNMQDKNGTTALHFAISSNNQGAVKALIEAGASVDVSDTQDHSPRDILNDFTSENPNIGYMRRFLPPSPPDTFPGNLIYPEPNRRIILVLTPYVGLVGIGLAAELAKIDLIKGFILFMAVCVIWAQVHLLASVHAPHNYIFPGAMAVYMSTKLMFMTYFFYEMYPNGIVEICGTPWWIATFAAGCSLWYNFSRTHVVDPGFVPNERTATWSKDIIQLAQQNKLTAATFCCTCAVRKPYRSKHCAFTNRCVAKFDHYCPFVCNAVGSLNHKSFMLFLMSMPTLVMLYLYGCYHYLYATCPVTDTYIEQALGWAYCKPFCVWTIFHGGLHTMWTSGLLMAQLHQVATDYTTNESMNRTRYEHMRYGSPWSKGCALNCIEFFRSNQTTDWRKVYSIEKKTDGRVV